MKPALMGAMMLWMAHGMVIADSPLTGYALVAFVGAHVVLPLVAVMGGVFVARLSPRMRGALARLHRPSVHHVAVMFGAAAFSAGVIHLIHGGAV